MKWTIFLLGANLACVMAGLMQPVLSPWLLVNAFAAGLLTMALALEWLERE